MPRWLGWRILLGVVGVAGIIEGYRSSSPFLVVVSLFVLMSMDARINESTLTRMIDYQHSQLEEFRRQLEQRDAAASQDDEGGS